MTQVAFSQPMWRTVTGYVNQLTNEDFTGDIHFDISPQNGLYVSTAYQSNVSIHFGWYKIMKSLDAGYTWSQCTDPPFVPAEDITTCPLIICVSPSELIACGTGFWRYNISSSSDYGSSWAELDVVQDYNPHSGDFIDLSTGMVLGELPFGGGQASIWKTKNNFTTLTYIDSLNFTHSAFQMINDTMAFILCRDEKPGISSNNKVFKTTDFGSTWTAVYSDTLYNLNDIHFTSLLNGFMVGNSGLILQTTDGGITWNPMVSGTIQNINSITSSNGVVFCAGNNGTILRKDPGTDVWTNISYFITSYTRIKVDNNMMGYLQTESGNILASYQPLNILDPKAPASFNLYPDPCRDLLKYDCPASMKLEKISIQNSVGQEILSVQKDLNGQLDISSLVPGVYLVSFYTGDQLMVRKLVKN